MTDKTKPDHAAARRYADGVLGGSAPYSAYPPVVTLARAYLDSQACVHKRQARPRAPSHKCSSESEHVGHQMIDMAKVTEQSLVDELVRRGWRFKETRYPKVVSGPWPKVHARQLQHTADESPPDTATKETEAD